ncbi:MAG: SpoIIE family protein phosphatase [Candidatus Competibacteraceae bacterium]|uniref:Response regulator receiver protein n=1 Tax=Candidatus Contendobacter odensis Run_B_J11 TaxID=1400861 RepID=A0A7U7GFQ3_9GAMM|nr:SpoIIE family protein phosphatase [Candidatus Contendobacter odensis]MBK8535014.1 SpoIIE family protein phosphatase [Candidatus Competibacteraceae bacterium]MBK8753344.1 SpoIIE family protein phosphatase [Candidatus Competibacteraceae bacterium]CDH47308.1 putative Response regulator receiver protein [Candidatus Contendobacter odensis Run_B_J11]
MSTNPVKILIIDDEERAREILVAYLEDSGFQVLQASDGQAGIELCRHEPFDLVLCDLRMPGMDGLQVLAAVTHEFPELPILVVSGLGGMSDAIQALKLGAWDYVTKPIEDMAVLEHAIDHALERARLRRENREYREHLEAVNEQLRQTVRQLREDEAAARRIQFQLLPENDKVYRGYQFSRHLLTSQYLSGDFVDYFAIDGDHLGFYMADVSGHGVSSAFVTVMLKSYMGRYRELYRQNRDRGILNPAETLSRLNREIFGCHMDKYLTMFYGVINWSNHQLRYSGGGQFPFPILFDGEHAGYVGKKSLPIGLFDFANYQTESLQLPPQFALVLISDGILETLPQTSLRDKQSFLLEIVGATELTIENLIQELGLDQSGSLPDDVTLLLIKRAK